MYFTLSYSISFPQQSNEAICGLLPNKYTRKTS